MSRKTAIVLSSAIALLLFVGSAVVVVRALKASRAAAAAMLQPFVSSPLDAQGTRLHLLRPTGWELTEEMSLRPSPVNAAKQRAVRRVYATFRAPKQPDTPFAWLGSIAPGFEKLVPGQKRPSQYIQVWVVPFKKSKRPTGVEKTTTWYIAEPGQRPFTVYVNYREWLSADGRLAFGVRYHCLDAEMFARTHPAITRSVRLE